MLEESLAQEGAVKLYRICMAGAAGLLIVSIARAQKTPVPQVECVAVNAKIMVNTDTSEPYWDIAARNGCEKDITAYSLVVSDLTDYSRSGTDLTRLLELSLPPSDDPYSITDVWRAGATLRLKSWPFNHHKATGGWAAIDAVIFADRSSAGDPEQISTLIQHRRNGLAMYRGFRDSWAQFLECPDGFGCLERALNARQDQQNLTQDIPEKGKRFGAVLDTAARELRAHPERWRENVQERVRVLDGTILLYQQQLATEQSSR
jgi:hypothetical protein